MLCVHCSIFRVATVREKSKRETFFMIKEEVSELFS